MPINRILTDIDRDSYQPTINVMWEICGYMMSRKISDANIQQALVLDVVRSHLLDDSTLSILSIGCFEDTAYEYLKETGTNITGIDPEFNFDLHSFTKIVAGEYNQSYPDKYDIIFATSVLEHVEDDEEFITDMCTLLKPNGIGILTMDFKDDYKIGDLLPATDVRFYTRESLNGLKSIIKKMGCEMVDEPDWTGKDNFVYQGHTYSFATFVFRKNTNV